MANPVRRQRLPRIGRFLGLAVLIVCATRLSLWHVENDIREAAYRHAFGHLYHNRGTWTSSFIGVCYGCSLVGRSGLPVFTTPFLLNRLRDCTPPVASESACYYSEAQPHHQIVHRTTEKTGAVFYTGAIWWVSWDTVRIEVGYYEGPLSASGNIYTIKRRNGRWVVIDNRMLWIS